MNVLETGIKNARNVGRYIFGPGSIDQLNGLIAGRRSQGSIIFLIDEFFSKNDSPIGNIETKGKDHLIFVSTVEEPTTDYIDQLIFQINTGSSEEYSTVVGIGGGITLDCAKAVSNLLGNGGTAADYQGWDLVPGPGIYKIGVPTISGTGAEATRTCVMTNVKSGLKLGMNSDYTVFDQLILDPTLTATVDRDQYFFTGMDSYIHCVESLDGIYRNPIGDAFSRQTLDLCRQVFSSKDMMNLENRSNLMVASYLGGCAIATSYVGLVHPLSAALSVVFGTHHCVANCIAMAAAGEFYPQEVAEFLSFCERQEVQIPSGVCAEATDDILNELSRATLMHDKPLTNKFGPNFRDFLTEDRIKRIFMAM